MASFQPEADSFLFLWTLSSGGGVTGKDFYFSGERVHLTETIFGCKRSASGLVVVVVMRHTVLFGIFRHLFWSILWVCLR